MNIVLCCRHLNSMSGGVERVITWLSNCLVEDGYNVTLMCWDTDDGTPFYFVDPRVRIAYLNIGDSYKKAGLKTRLQRILKIRSIIQRSQADVVVGFQIGTLLPLWLGSIFYKSKVVLTERNSLQFLWMTSSKNKKWIPYSYVLARKTIVQFEEFKKDYPKIVKLDVIHNPVFERKDKKFKRQNIVLSVGRHSFQKNYDILIEAFNEFHKEFKNWKLIILGNGEDELFLKQKISEFSLEEYVELAPPSKDIDSYYQRAKIFCLPSRWEGFPNALAEALASGLPSVGFSSCDGVNLLIKDGFNGFLAEARTPSDLAWKLMSLASDKSRWEELSVNAKTITSLYSPEKVYLEWNKMFHDIVK